MTIFYDFFDIEYGQAEYNSKAYLKRDKNGIPLISSKGTDRGIYGYYDIKSKYKHVISVPRTGSVCQAFYQNMDCCIDNNCLVLIPKKKLSIQEMIFFSMLIKKESYRYLYGRQVTPDRLGNTEISTIPEWVYRMPVIKSIDSKPFLIQEINLHDRKWLPFRYDELFVVKKGKRIVNSQMRSGKIPCVRPRESNNGVFKFIDIMPNHKSNTITVNYNGSVGEAFYQPVPYYALDDINILYPKFSLNVYIAMFLITLIKLEKYRYSYGRKWHKERMEKSIMRLPIDVKGQPDWQLMEDYIKSLPYSSNLKNNAGSVI